VVHVFPETVSVLEKTGGSKTSAAEILGIGIATLWRKLKQMGKEGLV